MKAEKRIRRQKFKTTYKKRINAVFVLYAVYSCLCFCAAIIPVLCFPREKAETAAAIGFGISLVLFLIGSAALCFAVVPRLKRAQADEDFLRHDFAPYVCADGKEIFKCEIHAYSYVLTSSPFAQDGESEEYLPDIATFNKYIEQFLPDRLISEISYENNGTYPDFYINYYSDDRIGYDGIGARVVKTIDGERTRLDIYNVYTAEFTDDGIKVGEKIYPYSLTVADVVTGFGHDTAYSVVIRILIGISDEGYLSFAYSSRIAELIKKHNIEFFDRKPFDYIASDPQRAFRQTALQLGLKKLK